MRTLFTFLFLTISIVCFSQNSIQNIEVKNETITDDIIDETLKVNALDIYSSPKTNDEGTNNPETTGSTKKIVNGKEIYIKESIVNGLQLIIVTEPK